MSTRIAPVKGMPDILPSQSRLWARVEQVMGAVLDRYGYERIETPVVEHTELFVRSIGDVTDIVEKEMYTFDSRGNTSLTLRPENTAGVVRAGVTHGLLHNQRQRLWYAGPMFRYERPQSGRYRQFHQVGAEAFGMAGPDIDAEMLLMLARMWRELGLDRFSLRLNTLGDDESRSAWRAHLVEYFSAHDAQLDDDSRRRLASNPLRILDSKNPALQDMIEAAPRLDAHLGAAARAHFDGLRRLLDAAGLEYEIDSRLVRGLDYYTSTVFEYQTDALGAQNAICGGGRYDNLVAQLGGRPTPALGWAVGVERLVALLEALGATIPAPPPAVYVISVGEAAALAACTLAERLRDEAPNWRVLGHGEDGSFKAQMRAADRAGAVAAIILGADELANNTVSIKPLRGQGDQVSVTEPEVLHTLAGLLGD